MLKQVIDRLSAARQVTAEDVLALRRAVYGDGAIGRDEAEAIFSLDERAEETDSSFGDFFVEALADYLVRQEEPRGYVSDDNARWLMSHISRDGRVRGETELELLVRVMEMANDCPRFLAAFALGEVKRAVIDGDGPLARGGALTPGSINEPEVELLRRILFAAAGDGRMAISRDEAEVLFDLNDATAGAPNHPAWGDLFSKAVANAVLTTSGYAPPPREEALARAKWLDEPSDGIAGFFSRAFGGGLKSVLDAYRAPSDEEEWRERNRREEALSAQASDVAADEAAWLVARIQRQGGVDANEVALLRFIAAEARDIHPDLKTLVDRAA